MKVFRTAVITCIVLYVGFSLLTGWWPRYGCVDIPIPGQGQTCGIQLAGTMDASLVVVLAVLGIVFLWCVFSAVSPQQKGDVQSAITMDQRDHVYNERILTTCSFCRVQTVGAGAATCARCGKPLPAAAVAAQKMRLPFGGWLLIVVAAVLLVGLFASAVFGRGSSLKSLLAPGATTSQQKAEATPPAWPQEPADFKGLKFGMRLSEAKQAAAGLKNCESFKNMCFCNIHTDLIAFSVRFDAGELAGITGDFTATDFDQLEGLFVSKYGKPGWAHDSVLQNVFGAGFQQRELAWDGKTMSIYLDRFARSSEKDIPGGGQKYDLTKGKLYVLPVSYGQDSARQAVEKRKRVLE